MVDASDRMLELSERVMNNVEVAMELFDELSASWSENVDALTSLVEESIDSYAFISAVGETCSRLLE